MKFLFLFRRKSRIKFYQIFCKRFSDWVISILWCPLLSETVNGRMATSSNGWPAPLKRRRVLYLTGVCLVWTAYGASFSFDIKISCWIIFSQSLYKSFIFLTGNSLVQDYELKWMWECVTLTYMLGGQKVFQFRYSENLCNGEKCYIY